MEGVLKRGNSLRLERSKFVEVTVNEVVQRKKGDEAESGKRGLE